MYQYTVLPGGLVSDAAERQRKLGKVYRLLIGLARKRRLLEQEAAGEDFKKQSEQVGPA